MHPYLLALLRTPSIGPVSFQEIIEQYPGDKLKNYFAENNISPDWKNIDNDLKWAEQPDHYLITQQSEYYPERLRQISSSPPILFVQGNISILKKAQIAMVGSRNPTPSGEDIAYQFAKSFSNSGLVVTSGLAMGIDAACHEGVLSINGETIAVMGTGPDLIYPKRHQSLAKKILERGCLITEFPTGVTPQAQNFPRRNRIISGLSLGVVVVEAAYASGSLVTAKYALEQNREVFAIPGSIHNPLSRGCHYLIKQGAKLVENIEDILDELTQGNLEIGSRARRDDAMHRPDVAWIERSEIQEKDPGLRSASSGLQNHTDDAFLKHVSFDPTPIDALITRSGLTAEQVSSILLVLELDGLVQSVPGGYVRIK